MSAKKDALTGLCPHNSNLIICYCKPNAFMEGGDSYMGENQIFVMAYHSTARIPPGNAETIRAPNRKIPVRCYSLFEIVV